MLAGIFKRWLRVVFPTDIVVSVRMVLFGILYWRTLAFHRTRKSNIPEHVAYQHHFFLGRKHQIRLREKPKPNISSLKLRDCTIFLSIETEGASLCAVPSPDLVFDTGVAAEKLISPSERLKMHLLSSTELSYLQTTSAPVI